MLDRPGEPSAADELSESTGSPADTTLTVANDSTFAPGARIGSYCLLQMIGHGGMGEVWLAEQQVPIRRRVAVKMIKAGMDTRDVVARFTSERQALAMMDHPGIARVFEAASTPTGRPFFAMEYVSGLPITTYCDKHTLTIRERLELFVAVCDAVQHAHQKAIIHRDLKPSNILVSEVDGRPAPKVIDFGVAKAVTNSLGLGTMVTRLGCLVGTIEYMSPEQADSGEEDVDTRADIYSLGVVLYELLAGARPLECSGLSFSEVLRKLREDDVPRPSTRVTTASETSGSIARQRRTHPASIVRQLRGDLDAITLKALEKDRRRRYSTAGELASDINRFLRNEPVTAHHPTASYRLSKYVARHRLAVTSSALVLLLLIGFAAMQAVQLRRITREKERADRVTAFMISMFRVSDPHHARGRDITARELLDEASKKIGSEASVDPEVRAALSHAMGTVYSGLGSYSEAEVLLQRSAQMRKNLLGPAHPETLESVRAYAMSVSQQGRLDKGAAILTEALATSRGSLGQAHPLTRRIAHTLAGNLAGLGQFAQAETLLRETSQYDRRALSPEKNSILATSESAAQLLYRQGRYEQSEKMLRALVEGHTRGCGPDSPCTLAAKGNLALTINKRGDPALAERLMLEMLATQRRVLGAEHPQTATTLYNLACIAARSGKREQALTLLADAVNNGLGDRGRRHAKQDLDLESLRGDARFVALIAIEGNK